MRPPVIVSVLNGLAIVMGLVAGAAVVLLSFLIVFDIVARSFFRFSLQGTDELGGYTLALIGSLGLSYTLLQRAHPRIDIVLRHFPLRARALLHVVAYAAMAGFAIFMTWHAVTELLETLKYGTVTNTPLQTPLWIPQGLWLLGTIAFAVTTVVCTVHAAWLLFAGRADALEARYGPPSVDEEVQEYVGEHPPAAGTG